MYTHICLIHSYVLMFKYIYLYIFIYVCIYIYIYIYIYIDIYAYVCIDIYMCVYTARTRGVARRDAGLPLNPLGTTMCIYVSIW
jgi:hypothetical protein